jgi:hypothetical protein
MKKYLYSSNINEITTESIKSFIDEFKAGNLKPSLKSDEEIDELKHFPLIEVVGSNFNRIVKDESKDVFV